MVHNFRQLLAGFRSEMRSDFFDGSDLRCPIQGVDMALQKLYAADLQFCAQCLTRPFCDRLLADSLPVAATPEPSGSTQV